MWKRGVDVACAVAVSIGVAILLWEVFLTFYHYMEVCMDSVCREGFIGSLKVVFYILVQAVSVIGMLAALIACVLLVKYVFDKGIIWVKEGDTYVLRFSRLQENLPPSW